MIRQIYFQDTKTRLFILYDLLFFFFVFVDFQPGYEAGKPKEESITILQQTNV